VKKKFHLEVRGKKTQTPGRGARRRSKGLEKLEYVEDLKKRKAEGGERPIREAGGAFVEKGPGSATPGGEKKEKVGRYSGAPTKTKEEKKGQDREINQNGVRPSGKNQGQSTHLEGNTLQKETNLSHAGEKNAKASGAENCIYGGRTRPEANHEKRQKKKAPSEKNFPPYTKMATGKKAQAGPQKKTLAVNEGEKERDQRELKKKKTGLTCDQRKGKKKN